jgi:hypothetical protein
MSMTREETLAYSRGYSAGMSNRWPAHRPPVPPEPITGELVASLQELRDKIDSALATFSVDDDLNISLSPAIDRATHALLSVKKWLSSNNAAEPPA